MKRVMLELERFLRWLAETSSDEKRERSAEIGEACQTYADSIGPVTDSLPEDAELGECES